MTKRQGSARAAIDWTDVRRRLALTGAAEEQNSSERNERILLERARQLARVPQRADAHASTLEFVTFSLAGERYAIEAVHVVSVLKLVELTRLPGAPPHLPGVTHLRGVILPVFDLRALLGVARLGLHDMSRLLVLGGANPEVGILADSIEEVAWIDPTAALAPAASIGGLGRAYLRGITRDALIVLDGRLLLDDPNLFVEDAVHPIDEDR